MKKHAALWGSFAALAVCWGSVSDAEPRKITQDQKEVLRRGLSQVLRRVRAETARPCAIAWTATVEPCHTAASMHSLMPERCREAKWSAARRAVGEITAPFLGDKSRRMW